MDIYFLKWIYRRCRFIGLFKYKYNVRICIYIIMCTLFCLFTKVKQYTF